jgi:hypothetical protein
MTNGMVSASPTISIFPASITGLNQGDSFRVDVKVDPEGQPVNVVEINLKFDPAVVQIDSYNTILCAIVVSKCSITSGDFLGYNPVELLNDINNTNGMLHISHVVEPRRPEVTAPGTYVTLNFKVNSNAPIGRSTLGLTIARLRGMNGYIPGVTANNGTITIENTSSASQTASAVVTTPVPNTPGFSAPMALIAVIGHSIKFFRKRLIK